MKLEDINNMKLRDKDIFVKYVDSNEHNRSAASSIIHVADNSNRDTVHVFEVIRVSEKASEELSPGDIVYIPWAMTRGIVDFEDDEGHKYTFSDVDQVMLVLDDR